MSNVTPPVSPSNAPSARSNVHNCSIVDATALLYQPAVRAAVMHEQAALLATRLALARWSSGNDSPVPLRNHAAQPFRAAFYARAQEDFFAWIARGGVWEPDGDCTAAAPLPGNQDNTAVR